MRVIERNGIPTDKELLTPTSTIFTFDPSLSNKFNWSGVTTSHLGTYKFELTVGI
jgi:hypothetical protein